MNRRSITAAGVALLALAFTTPALPHDPPPGGCGSFSTDVARELALMRQPPIAMTASSASDRAPRLSPDKHYAVSLIAQRQAGRPFTLQLSGRDDAIVGLAITAVPPSKKQDPT